MSIKTWAARLWAARIDQQTKLWSSRPVESQLSVFNTLIQKAANTAFGKAHDFASINSYEEFKKRVPVMDYEGRREWFERNASGELNVMWPGKPLYLAKTSGTTSGVKYIPITRDSIPNHIHAARNAILAYVHDTGKADFLDGKLIFLSGSPVLDKKNGILTGRLSGISNHHVPSYLRTNQMPSYPTNCIEDWEEKVEKIVDETVKSDMRLISGIPPWVQMYFDRLYSRTGKLAGELFPNFSLFIYGGVNFEPYRQKLEQSIGRKVDSIELFPASEGFFAYQNQQDDNGLLLLLDAGIFYEFIPAENYFDPNPPRLHIGEVELNKNYALVLSSNAGLWAYSIGDTVRFVSKNPYKIRVSGRIKHFISAFGEHVIGEEVDEVMKKASAQFGLEVLEFHVAPQVAPPSGLPYHEWFIEIENPPSKEEEIAIFMDELMRRKNIYYDDLITGSILRPLVIRWLKPGSFADYMKSVGRLGGQNKLPRLANDREIANRLNLS